MIDEIVDKAKNNQNGSFKGNQFKKVVSGSAEPDSESERTNIKLAELANTSKASVQRMKKVKV